MTECITRNEVTEHLPKMLHPVPGHEPKWTSVDCPADGDYPCGEQHPDVLICSDDEEDYPCHVVQMVANELERMANTPFEDGPWWALASSLRDRAKELRGDLS